MKRITFLIGNGFDLNVGLDTRYRNFYDYYVAKHPDDLLSKEIESKYLFWSDLELALGRYTERIKDGDEESFWDSEELLEQELAYYLDMQEKRVKLSGQLRVDIAVEMQRSITEFYLELPDALQQKIKNIVYHIDDNIHYSFITFNYTNVFDQCLYMTRKAIIEDFGKHKCHNGASYSDVVDDVLHIHGTTKEDMVLGVNDDSQVANVKFIENNLYRSCLIKEEASRSLDPGKIEQTSQIIDESVIICVFGMSIGNTDKMWWNYICRWLSKDEKRLLVIFAKTEKKGKRTLFAKLDDIFSRLKNNAEMTDEVWKKIKEQIFVKCNAGIFRFKVIDEEKKLGSVD